MMKEIFKKENDHKAKKQNSPFVNGKKSPVGFCSTEPLRRAKRGIYEPPLRFKKDDGTDYADWEERTLGEIGEFKTSSVDKKIKPNERLVYLVNYMNVYNHETITNEKKKSLMQVSAKDLQIEKNNLLKGDILFTPSSETPTDIGRSIVITENLENTLYSYHLIRFRPNIEMDNLYSHYFCNCSNVLNQFSKLSCGSTRFTLSVNSFSKVRVKIPTIKEQTKIAHFLSAIDKKITLSKARITQEKEYKKGLMQRMFI